MKIHQVKKGFTLVEMLVVISIISTLSSVVLSSVNSARSRARDAQRISDLGEMKKALALYYDEYGYYPDASITEYSSTGTSPEWNTVGNPLYALVTQGFISRLPVDPKNTPVGNHAYNSATSYAYMYSTYENNYKTNYDLITRLENPGNPNSCEKRDPLNNGFCNVHTITSRTMNWVTTPFVIDGGKIMVDH